MTGILEGLDQLGELAVEISRAGLVVSDIGLTRAVKEIAEVIVDEQRAGAPVGATGDTKNTISAVYSKGDHEALCGTETWYAHFIEDGTVDLPPRPFIHPPGTKHEAEFDELVLQYGSGGLW